jgi:hypothetical protein
MRRLFGLAGLAVAALTLAVTPALAGKPGSGGGGGTTSAWVSASPNPAASGGAKVGVSGCGLDVATTEMDIVHSAGYTEVLYVPVWSPGCLDTNTYFLTKEAGTYTINIYQMSSTKRNATKVLKASTTLTVT